MEEFNYCVQASPSGATEYRFRTANFGDGYSQSAADGINNSAESWDITVKGFYDKAVGSQPKISDVISFFNNHAGYKSFLWVAPDGISRSYVVKEFSKTLDAGVWTINATFEEVFR